MSRMEEKGTGESIDKLLYPNPICKPTALTD